MSNSSSPVGERPAEPDPPQPNRDETSASAGEAAADEDSVAAPVESLPPDGGESVPDRPPDEPADRLGTGQEPPSAWPDDKADGRQQAKTVIVRYGLMVQIGEFRHDLDPPPPKSEKVVVRTERGVELGEVITAVSDETNWRSITPEQLKAFLKANGAEYPFRRGGKVLRIANHQDIIDYRHLEKSAREEGAFCREQIRQLELKMDIITVEHLLGGERIIFYFSAEGRVDFRELVRHLAGQYRTRIEMRQVGARDEARLVADYERCGQRCCCQEFLKNLKPVSMRMAKMQKATLDPSKISGRCGRLMCCLRYEDAGYEELRRKLPKKSTWVRTREAVGRVTDTHILTQLVRLSLADNTQVMVSNEDIIERDMEPAAVTAKPEKEKANKIVPAVRGKGGRLLHEEVVPAEGKPGDDEFTGGRPSREPALATEAAKRSGDTDKKDRRQKERKTPANSQVQADKTDAKAGADKSSQRPATTAKKKRKRRRRKKNKPR